MIKVYGKEDCSNCVALKRFLDDSEVEYIYIEDLKELMKVASKARIMSAPVVDFNGDIMGMDKFLNLITPMIEIMRKHEEKK